MHTYTRASMAVYDTRTYIHITQIYCRRNWGIVHLALWSARILSRTVEICLLLSLSLSLSLSLPFLSFYLFSSFSSVSSGFYRFVVFSFLCPTALSFLIKLLSRCRLSAERILINRASTISFQTIQIVFFLSSYEVSQLYVTAIYNYKRF